MAPLDTILLRVFRTKKGGNIMRKKHNKISAMILTLLALGSITLVSPLVEVVALAADTDLDGFSNALEGSPGITFPSGLKLIDPNTGNQLASLPSCTSGVDRTLCVDPATKDLFVIINRANGVCPASTCGDPCAPTTGKSDIPSPPYNNGYNTDHTYGIDPLGLIKGLGVTPHELIGTSQIIGGTGGWYPVKIVENLNPCSSVMGLATFGTFPTGYTGSAANIWPEKIKNWINKTCSQACFTDSNKVTTCYTPANALSFTCKNGNSDTSINMRSPDPALMAKLNAEFIQNVVSHETSHMIHLAAGSGTSADHHYPAAQGILMEQSIKTVVTKDISNNIKVTLYISNQYQPTQDLKQFWLKHP